MTGSNDGADDPDDSPSSTASSEAADGVTAATDSADGTAAEDAADGTGSADAESGHAGEADGETSGATTDAGDGPSDDSQSVAEKADLDMSTIGESRKPDPRVRYQWVLRAAIVSLVVGGILGAVAFLFAEEVALLPGQVQAVLWVGGGTAVVLFAFGTVRALLLYRSWEYVVREDSLYLSRGVFTRVRTIVPYVRVQHIDTQHNPVERLLGLSTLVVYTAGSRGADVTIPGLTPDRAEDLQTRLKVLAIESEEEDAV